MAIGDEPLSSLSNLLARHWLCDFRNNHRVRRRHLPPLHAQCSQTRLASAPKCVPNKQKFAYEFSPTASHRVDRVLSLAATDWGNDGPNLDRGLGAGGRDRGPRSHEARAARLIFQCAKIMNSSRNEIVTGTPKRKSLNENSWPALSQTKNCNKQIIGTRLLSHWRR
jgi:hypothetical protein